MSDAEWDAEDFDPVSEKPVVVASDKWQGEDEDDDIKESWDQEEEDKEPEKEGAEGGAAASAKKKKSLKEKIAEREEKKRREAEEKKKQEDEQAERMTPAEQAEEKLRLQKLQEDADLALAIAAFGEKDSPSGDGPLDRLEPQSKEDFDKFHELLREKITKYERSPHYVPFLENLFRDLALGLEADDIKKLSSTLTALSNEKVKQQKGTKGKKKGAKKATLTVGKDTKVDDLGDEDTYNDYDDFI